MRIAVFPGSFDPFTTGHLELAGRASALFDRVYAAVLVNPDKKSAFSLEERLGMIQSALRAAALSNVEAAAFSGLTVEFARSVGAGWLIRGLRGPSDLEYEMRLEAANRRLHPGLQTVYLASAAEQAFISSSAVREIASFGGDLDGLVPDAIKNMIAERLIKR